MRKGLEIVFLNTLILASVYSINSSAEMSSWKKFRFGAASLIEQQKLNPLSVVVNSPQKVFSNKLLKNVSMLSRMPERVQRRVQKIGSATVVGTWLSEIYNADGTLVYRAGDWLENTKILEERAHRLAANRENILAYLRQQSSELLNAKELRGPELIIEKNNLGSYEFFWTLDFVNADETKLLRIVADERAKIIRTTEHGDHFVDGLAVAYPNSPRASALSEVVLKSLDGSGLLSGAYLKVTSALSSKAESQDNVFKYETQDPRFDQVQSYFFAEKVLNWFKARFDATPLYKLEVKVQVGEKSNAAFYYGGRVRLGSGDDVKFKRILHDPSIIMHEVGHSIVERFASLPSEGFGGSLNEAFADFFAASLLDSPRMGEASYMQGPYVRTLENNMRADRDLNGGLYNDSLVISGAFWELRSIIGSDMTEMLAFRTLSRLGGAANMGDFIVAIKAAAETTLSARDQSVLGDVLSRRAFR